MSSVKQFAPSNDNSVHPKWGEKRTDSIIASWNEVVTYKHLYEACNWYPHRIRDKPPMTDHEIQDRMKLLRFLLNHAAQGVVSSADDHDEYYPLLEVACEMGNLHVLDCLLMHDELRHTNPDAKKKRHGLLARAMYHPDVKIAKPLAESLIKVFGDKLDRSFLWSESIMCGTTQAYWFQMQKEWQDKHGQE